MSIHFAKLARLTSHDTGSGARYSADSSYILRSTITGISVTVRLVVDIGICQQQHTLLTAGQHCELRSTSSTPFYR
jgi:hypothetical protein